MSHAHYVLGCVDSNCECDPCCCDPSPNCDPSEVTGEVDDSGCCYGPWDTYVKDSGGNWQLDHTIYCLTDVYDYYNSGAGMGSGEYLVVLSGEATDWDPLADNSTPECWFDIDPYPPG